MRKVGQFRKDQMQGRFLNEINTKMKYMGTGAGHPDSPYYYENPCYEIDYENNIDQTLYVELKVERRDVEKHITICLCDNTGAHEQRKESFIVPKRNPANADPYLYSFVFKPISLDLNNILIRQSENYHETLNTSINVYKVNNIYNMLGNRITIKSLGIQAPANTNFVIEGEKIQVGRNGMYQIEYEGLEIKDIGIIEKDDSKNNFIIDYTYE